TAADGQLFRLGFRRASGLFAHPLRGRTGRTLFPGRRPRSSSPPYPARLAARPRRTDATVELLRSPNRHQRPHHDAHSRAVRGPNRRSFPASPHAAGSAASLPYLVRSAPVRIGLGGLDLRLCRVGMAIYLAKPADAVRRSRRLSALVLASPPMALF